MRKVAQEFTVFVLCFLAVTLTSKTQVLAGAAVESGKLWPSKEIPYAICDCRGGVPDICTKVQCLAKPEIIVKAISDWNASGLKVKLVPRDKSNKKPYIVYLAQEDDTNLETGKWRRWCFTQVGYAGTNSPHPVVIGDVCVERKGSILGMTVLHETGHAVGLYHEQQRTDRDVFLTVKFPGGTASKAIGQSGRICSSNEKEKCEFQSTTFNRYYNFGRDVGEHDLKSIMHYPLSRNFDDCVKTESKTDDDNLACIDLTPKGRKRAQELSIQTDQIGSKVFGLSPLDIATINELYKDVP